jgi:hypothetical protein
VAAGATGEHAAAAASPAAVAAAPSRPRRLSAPDVRDVVIAGLPKWCTDGLVEQ